MYVIHLFESHTAKMIEALTLRSPGLSNPSAAERSDGFPHSRFFTSSGVFTVSVAFSLIFEHIDV